jgi:hypothetical protein
VWTLRFVLGLAIITTDVSGQECWFGAIGMGFGEHTHMSLIKPHFEIEKCWQQWVEAIVMSLRSNVEELAANARKVVVAFDVFRADTCTLISRRIVQ